MASLFESGFFVGQAPWHGMGNIVPEDTRFNVHEGLIAAGLNWDVYTRPCGFQTSAGLYIPQEDVFDRKGEVCGSRPQNVYTMRRMLVDHPLYNEDGTPKLNEDGTPKSVAVEEEQKLGLVSGEYEVVQNTEIFDWFQPYLDSREATLHTAGSLKGGRLVWCLAKLNQKPVEIVKNDFIETFLLLSSSHDGTQKLRVGFTPIRVVCANTLAQAHKCKESKLLGLKHTKHIHVTLSEIHDIVNPMTAAFEATVEKYRILASRKVINPQDLERYVYKVLKDGKEIPEGGMKTRMQNIVDSVTVRMNHAANQTAPNSWWSAYNAVTEHFTWAAGGDAGGEGGDEEGNGASKSRATLEQKTSNRIASLWLGQNLKKNEAALELALEMAV
jgi:phage/plasmid-like protein (TIGR03299 family)